MRPGMAAEWDDRGQKRHDCGQKWHDRAARVSRGREGGRFGKRQRRVAWLFLAPSLAGVVMFHVVPFLDVIRRSFLDAMGKTAVGFSNYRAVFQNEAFQLAAGNNLRFLAVCLPLLLLVSFGLALLVFRRDGKGGFCKISLVLPMVVPAAAMVLVWKIVLCPDGVLNQILGSVNGLVDRIAGRGGTAVTPAGVDWVNGPTAFPVLVFTYIWKNAGYNLLLWLAGLASIPESLYDAARVDGAGAAARLRYITIPGLSGTFGLVLILSVVNSFRVYRESYLLAGSYPDMSIYMIPHLFSHWFLTLDVQNLCTASMILLAAALSAVLTGAAVVVFVLFRDHMIVRDTQ